MKKLTIGITAIAAAAALVACGQKAPEIKIGHVAPLTGGIAHLGKDNENGARMAVEDFGGRVLGRPIEVVAADHQNKTDVGAALARRWLDADDVKVIVDVPNSAIALAVQLACFAAMRLLRRDTSAALARGDMAEAVFLASVSVVLGVLNAACLS